MAIPPTVTSVSSKVPTPFASHFSTLMAMEATRAKVRRAVRSRPRIVIKATVKRSRKTSPRTKRAEQSRMGSRFRRS
jgi:hypothetical protein